MSEADEVDPATGRLFLSRLIHDLEEYVAMPDHPHSFAGELADGVEVRLRRWTITAFSVVGLAAHGTGRPLAERRVEAVS